MYYYFNEHGCEYVLVNLNIKISKHRLKNN